MHAPVVFPDESELTVLFHEPQTMPVRFFPVRGLRQIKFPGSTGVDNRNSVPVPLADKAGTGIGLMDMPVNHHRGMPGIQQRAETLKSAVRKVILIP